MWLIGLSSWHRAKQQTETGRVVNIMSADVNSELTSLLVVEIDL